MKRQLGIFVILLVINAFLAFVTFAFLPLEQLTAGMSLPPDMTGIPLWLLGLANAGLILVIYGFLGLLGIWFARKLDLPGIFREQAGWRRWLMMPMIIGAIVGVLIVLIDRLFSVMGDWPGFTHPTFPFSLIASVTAGIGEEILYRLFVMGLWAFLLNLILVRLFSNPAGATRTALWIANLIAALAFAAAHLPAAMMILGVETPGDLPPVVLAELFVLNGLLGLVAGERYMKDGLVAAAGVHFWADFVWHVLWPLFG